ncbi:UNC93-like protein 2 [Linum perenne]
MKSEIEGSTRPGNVTAVKSANKSGWRYNSPKTQIILLGLVYFCCAGMYKAFSGMGGGGQLDPTASNNANTATYITFAVFSFVGGGLFNIIGPRVMLPVGCTTYVLFTLAFLYYNHHPTEAVIVVAGGLIGVGGGLMWAVQGAIMTTYPPAAQKGTYISIFWAIFNFGGVIGGLIPFTLNYNSTAPSVGDGTYIGFTIFMGIGTLISFAILPPAKVIRDDGSRCTEIKRSNVSKESLEILKLFSNWRMILITPAALASNFYYTYQFNDVNAIRFNIRTRGLNNVVYWGAQMIGSFGIGYVLDFSLKSRRNRGFIGIAIFGVLGTAIWGAALANQLGYSFEDLPEKLDFKNSGKKFAGPFIIYFWFGFLDAVFQSMVYWVIGAMATDSEVLSRYVGFYKGIQCVGAAVAWQLDTKKVPMIWQLAVNWFLTTLSYPVLVFLVMWAVKDDDSVKGRDETGNLEDDGNISTQQV